jgi:hypothetical protein
MFEVDARPILLLIHAPTLVLHRSNLDFVPIQHGRYLAEHVPGAKLIELPGVEGPLVWEMPQLTLDHVQEFLTGVGRVALPTCRWSAGSAGLAAVAPNRHNARKEPERLGSR